jgi:hypothetical protein
VARSGADPRGVCAARTSVAPERRYFFGSVSGGIGCGVAGGGAGFSASGFAGCAGAGGGFEGLEGAGMDVSSGRDFASLPLLQPHAASAVTAASDITAHVSFLRIASSSRRGSGRAPG